MAAAFDLENDKQVGKYNIPEEEVVERMKTLLTITEDEEKRMTESEEDPFMKVKRLMEIANNLKQNPQPDTSPSISFI
jgi:hypothetical protein